MDFKKATDILTAKMGQREIAAAAGVSKAAVRQARLRPDAVGHRSPPPGWEDAVVRLAEERARELQDLARELREAGGP